MRVLVAGGAGFVGSALVPELLKREHEVEVVDLLWFGNHLPSGVKVRQTDVLNLGPGDVEGFDAVVFLAGLSNDPMADYSPAVNFVANASSPAFLAYLARKAGVRRFVYGGSCSVYGYTEDQLYDETSPTIATYPYGISKLQGEHAVTSMSGDGFSVIALRKGTVCGYSPRMRFDLVVNTMFKSAVTEGKIRVNNPAIWRPILALRDAVDAYVRAIEAAPDVSGTFNVASGNFTVGELGTLVRDGIREHLGREVVVETLDVHDLRNYKVSCARAEKVLGFAPRASIPDIVADLAGHLSEYGDFSSRSYYNIETFKALDLGDFSGNGRHAAARRERGPVGTGVGAGKRS